MSKRCPHCGFVNDDTRIYCGSCGELLDKELRLLKNLSDQASGPWKPEPKAPPSSRESVPPKEQPDEDYVPSKLAQKQEKTNIALWIGLGAVLIAAVILVVKYVL